jgi:hypothetical protein
MHRFATLAIVIATVALLAAVAFAGTAPWAMP